MGRRRLKEEGVPWFETSEQTFGNEVGFRSWRGRRGEEVASVVDGIWNSCVCKLEVFSSSFENYK